MPTLKDLNCSIELSDSQRALQEFGTTYNDGCVETFVAVPSKPESFSIHLTSDRFIAPGISMYVFVDGVYQCNRNRQDLKLTKESNKHSVVDFRVRQKEEKQKDGSMIAREWKFDKLDTSKCLTQTGDEHSLIAAASADNSFNTCSQNMLDNLGCIEVLVLRCAGTRNAKTTSAMNMDGAGDFQPPPFALDGQPRTTTPSVYDDRGPYFGGHGNAQPAPGSTYRTPYAETVHSHDTKPRSHYNLPPFAPPYGQRPRSRTSGQFSPDAKPVTSIPSEAFHYGSGPIPKGPMHRSERSFYHIHPASVTVTNAPRSDPAWLNEMLTKAAKRGVEEYRRNGLDSKAEKQNAVNLETASQPPGAWPQSPYAQLAQAPNASGSRAGEDADTAWDKPTGGWGTVNVSRKSKAQVKRDTDPEWDSQSVSGSWGAPDETSSDTWDTDETWRVKEPSRTKDSQWGTSRAASGRSKSKQRNKSPDTTRTRRSHNTRKGRSRMSRSISRSGGSAWGDNHKDDGGRLPVEATSESAASSEASDSTAQPSRSRSPRHNSKDRSKTRKYSCRARFTHRSEGRSPKHLRGGADIQDPSARGRATSMASGLMPEVMNAPIGMPTTAYSSHEPLRSVGFAAASPALWAPPEAQHALAPPAPPAPFSSYGDKSPWGVDNTTGWGDTNTPGNVKDDWTIPQDDKDSWEVIDHPKKDKDKKKASSGWEGGLDKIPRTKEMKSGWDTYEDVWATDDKPTKPNTVKWDTQPDDWAPVPKDPEPTKAAPTSKRHTTKSLSKYRKHSPPPSPPGPKSHWQFPPPPSSTPLPSASPSTLLLPAEPRLKVPSSTASSKGVSHHVRAGPGSSYGHMIGRPTYLDTLEKPYAVFRFKYRSRGVLKELFGHAVSDKKGELTTRAQTPATKVRREKEKLEGLGREELVERMVRLKMEVEGEKERGRKREQSRSTESVARGLTERWVERQSRDMSN